MTLKEQGMNFVIEAQKALIKNLREEMHGLAYRNLQLKEHMKVLCSHPVGLAAKMIAKKYSHDGVTRELQLASMN